MSISVQSKITVAAENGPKFLTALKPVFDNVATNPACTYSEVFQDTQNPGTFRFIQNWNCTKEDLKEVND
ncbi:hypothetical protein BU16DRAFT_521289 [Lophium mytilinum]|uniref:ABM domain-containing protein n=1 Tax=Lophium mytilinum TaxID=390894 RepID=A0A6A6RCS6_9PEZI|nr:hypothetical protein BU16DRAFT_521289 [Lophium mytilinum]